MMGHVGGGRMKSKISFNPIANSSTDMSNNSDTGPPQRRDLRVLLHPDDEDFYSTTLTAIPPYDRPSTSSNHDEGGHQILPLNSTESRHDEWGAKVLAKFFYSCDIPIPKLLC